MHCQVVLTCAHGKLALSLSVNLCSQVNHTMQSVRHHSYLRAHCRIGWYKYANGSFPLNTYARLRVSPAGSNAGAHAVFATAACFAKSREMLLTTCLPSNTVCKFSKFAALSHVAFAFADTVCGSVHLGSGHSWLLGRISFASLAVYALHLLWPFPEPSLHCFTWIVSPCFPLRLSCC